HFLHCYFSLLPFCVCLLLPNLAAPASNPTAATAPPLHLPPTAAAMKPSSPTAAVGTALHLVKTPNFVKFAAVALLSLSVALLFYHHPSFPSAAFSAFTFASNSSPTAVPANSTSTALNSTSIAANTTSTILKVKKLPPPPPSVAQRTGIVDENGAMTEDFDVGEFDPSLMEELRDLKGGAEETEKRNEPEIVKYGKFKPCDESKIDYIPCLDSFERHCPDSTLVCIIPMPNGYQKSLPWPRSRDELWLHNVPDTRLVQDQGSQYSMSVKDDKISFQDGGSDQYLNLVSQMVPEIDFGHQTRIALDIGSGIGSFAASLFKYNVVTLSIGTKDVHKNQIQFALERGLPAMVAGFGARRLPYASQAFDLIRCSGSGIDLTVDNGVLLLEVNRLLRAGRYFVWGGPQVDSNHERSLEDQWKEMEDLAARICWQLVKKEGNVGIWCKPLNNSCYLGREIGAQPPLCSSSEDPDNVWYVNMTACITPLPKDGNGGNVSVWPARLHSPPDRLQSIKMDAMISRKELMKAESRYWNEIIGSYVRAFHWKEQNFRNVLDMRAGFGGCEPFDTYPRSYDLIHAAGLFSDERKRCNFSTILLEMDRMLRPGGTVYIRDTLAVIGEIHDVASAMGWVVMVHDTSEGPHASWKFLACEKRMP
ncbi:unnamed protein product, partial [Linum tenue]